MLNSGGLPGPGTYFDLRDRILQRFRSEKINDQVFGLVQSAFEKILIKENIVLSRPEKKRLLAHILKSVLAEMTKQLDES